MSTTKPRPVFSSFRDPSGFVFQKDGLIYRQVNPCYQAEYDHFVRSGLFRLLLEKGYLIEHEEVKESQKGAYKILKARPLPFVSYPYEWSFHQYQDAALLTLQIEELALSKGMSLKDASAYNIQFTDGRPVLIDLLSFQRYQENQPWVAYRQFCQHFLAPLALMAYQDLRLGQLLSVYLDGIPLDLATSLLPWRTRLVSGLATHLHLHAWVQKKKMQSKENTKTSYQLSQKGLLGIVDSLRSTILGLKLSRKQSIWSDYYQKTNYTPRAFQKKKQIIARWLAQLRPKRVWDVGANTGYFSRVALMHSDLIVATDSDPLAVDYCYEETKRKKEPSLLPLVVDLVNPSPAIGWQNKERLSFLERAQFDLTMALALIHHLVIGDNLPFSYLASLFAQTSRFLIIEFVPKEDSNAQRLLRDREDTFPYYTEKQFVEDFKVHFQIKEKVSIGESKRVLYLMERKGGSAV